ncbi:MAG: asparagine synthase (glutamine-hydrolyzing) [Elusimicrobia bacterium]|nr:asparagine synthase (glutamine-hydrolyzing) [Elusimicrobiota bacterium]
MCGIIASASWQRPVDEAALARGLSALRHRGPDGSGAWLSPTLSAGLGHARLSLVDLEGGAQPLASEDGAIAAAVNGELYDDARLRAGLEARGHRFRTRSDSELVVHLYEEEGAALVSRLRGEFAFVLWDERRQELLAVRDRFGVKPLCYALHDGRLLVASEAKALFAAGAPAAWDLDALYHAASLQFPPPGRTLFAGVRQVPPGGRLLADWRGVRLERYWDLDFPSEAADGPGGAGAASELSRRLEEAVRLRLRADVPVACCLSGGIDSSAVFALACRHAPRPPDCFTVSFAEAAYDELGLAAETARRAGATLHALRVTDGDLASALPDAVYHAEGLAVNAHLAAKFLLSRSVRDAGFKIVLTGEGGDEALAGYPHFQRDWLLEQGLGLEALERAHALSAGIMLPAGPGRTLEAARRRLGFVPSYLEAKASLGGRLHAVLEPELLARFEERDALDELLEATDVAGQLAGRSRVHQSQYLWAKSGLAHYILRTLGDGTEMAHGVEGRLPFLDQEVFAFARGLRPEALMRGGLEKLPLREAMRGLLPDAVVDRPKHPFYAPPVSGRLEELLQDVLRSGPSPLFDRAAVLAVLERRRGDARERLASDPVLMTVLTACLLERRFGL